MLKEFDLQVRKTGMDHAGFVAHWLNVHAPLSAGIANVEGYVLNEVLELSPSGDLAPLRIEPLPDGIAQLWFQSPQAMQAVVASDMARRWLDDSVNYVGRQAGIATVERIVRAPPNKVTTATYGPAYKLIRMLRRRAGLNADDFRQRWRGSCAAEMQTLPALTGFVQSDVSAIYPASGTTPVSVGGLSGIDELWFRRHGEARHAALMLANQLAAAKAAICEAVCTLLIAETTIIAPPR